MAYLSLYRKWRPQTFADVVGQKYVVTTLENSLASGRISHAYLFAGPRGTGKTTLARLLAAGLNCEDGPTAAVCGRCRQCEAIRGGWALNVIEIDGASNRGIDEVRELREQARYAPTEGRYKVYIIDEVHMLTGEAFNALLKIIEEPPEHVIFMFATTDPHKIPATIISRCQRHDLRRFPVAEIRQRLRFVLDGEGHVGSDEALELIARHAEGGMRDALGILDQCLAFGGEVTVDLVNGILGAVDSDLLSVFAAKLAAGESDQLLAEISSMYDDGRDLLQFTRSFIHYLRQGLLAKKPPLPTAELQRALEVFAAAEKELRYSFDPKLPLELAVLQFVDLPGQWRQLQDKITVLEETIKQLQTRTTAAPVLTDTEELDRPRTAPAAGGSSAQQLAAIQDHWEGFLQALRDQRLVQSEAFLREAYPAKLQGAVLTLAFPKERGFHKASIEQEKHRVPAERTLSKYFGRSLEIACVTGNPQDFAAPAAPKPPEPGLANTVQQPTAADSGTNAAPEPPEKQPRSQETTAAEPPSEGEEYDETVAAALKLFGGRVVKVEDSQKGGA